MRRPSLFLAPSVAALACLILSACTGGATHPAVRATASAAKPATGPAGSPGHPVVFSCAEESFSGDSPVPQRPQPGDLAVGPLIIPGGQRLAMADPAGYGDHGSYKIPFIVPMGATVTVTIDPPARGRVVISNPYAPAGVTAATYRPCAHVAGFYAQGFAFTNGQVRGCVPLEVRSGDQPQVRHVTLSLFAGSCVRLRGYQEERGDGRDHQEGDPDPAQDDSDGGQVRAPLAAGRVPDLPARPVAKNQRNQGADAAQSEDPEQQRGDRGPIGVGDADELARRHRVSGGGDFLG
jgi:hypothetical protein